MSVPRQLIAVRRDLEPKLVKALREVLVGMDSDPEGQQVLRRQQKSTKIDEIPVAAMQQLRSIEKFVFSLPEKVSTW
jgi:ABC-type phosphate/phosphonate transport system substrate-binding protein